MHYQNGRLIKAITRGNGVQGDDVTKNVFSKYQNYRKKFHF
ncbi:hypothetical protein NWQ34_02240 [Mycoplasmopsis felis]|nr:hypothetical protein [Mycoplasmopsis felis]MCU9938495.1 hypothetical protein [Mycoplasmopsis felis]